MARQARAALLALGRLEAEDEDVLAASRRRAQPANAFAKGLNWRGSNSN